MRTGTSLKRATLRLSCQPLNLTADLSHYLLSFLLRSWGTAGFEKSHLPDKVHPLSEVCPLRNAKKLVIAWAKTSNKQYSTTMKDLCESFILC